MKLKYPFESMKMRDKVIAVPAGEGTEAIHGALKLNKTATALLEMLKEETSEEQMVEAMMKRFDVPREIVEKDVRNTVEEFRKIGLID